MTFVAVAPAGATLSGRTTWDVDLTAKDTTTWSFSGQRPDTCAQYLGIPGEEANGSGSQSLSVATTKRRRIWAETYRLGRKLRFSSFATDGWSIPATSSKRGTASTQAGKPCDWSAGDPEPLPDFLDASGCGTTKGIADPTLTWTPGTLVVRLGGPMTPSAWVRCPDPGEPKLFVFEDTTCGPKEPATIYLSALKFMLPKPKRFTVEAKHRYVCPVPVTNDNWKGGTTSLTIERSTSYEVTFTPRKR